MNWRGFTFLLGIAPVLIACVALSPEQIHSSSNDQICSYWNDDRLYEEQSVSLLKKETAKRNLDCSPDHLTCASYGLHKGSDKYVECRMEQQRLAAEKEQLHDFMKGLESIQKRQHSHETIYGY